MKSLLQRRVVFFDVDGTLYYQKRLRRIMALRLLAHVARRPDRWRDLKIISTFRRMREEIEIVEGELAVQQYRIVAERLSLPVPEVETVVEQWMHRAPLVHLRSCRDDELAALIAGLRQGGVLTIAYSDYPAADKLAALGIEMDQVFCATDAMINCLKPDPRGLRAIVSKLALNPSACFFIGDRQEKDGLCAERAGMDFAILPSTPVARKRAYQQAPFLLR